MWPQINVDLRFKIENLRTRKKVTFYSCSLFSNIKKVHKKGNFNLSGIILKMGEKQLMSEM